MKKMKMKYNRATEQVQLRPDLYSSSDCYYSCEKHPRFDSVGICAYCLRDRLLKLIICSDCGEQLRLSSCSCSSVEIGSVGRMSFLIENEGQTSFPNLQKDQIVKLKRSNSTHMYMKRSRSGFWRLSAPFRKKQSMDDDAEDGSWGGFSRSRSLCSFRGGWKGVTTSEEGGSVSVSGGRSSGVTWEPEDSQSQRRSEMKDEVLSGFSETKMKGVGNHGIRESYFEAVGESGFIDLDLQELEKQSSGQKTRLEKMRLDDSVLVRKERKVKKRMWKWFFGGIIL